MIARVAGLAAGAILYASMTGGAAAAATCDKPVDLRFTFWGTAFEKNDIEAATQSFNASHPCIRVESQHIPYPGYAEKLTTMLAAGTPPDVAYLAENQAFPWAQGRQDPRSHEIYGRGPRQGVRQIDGVSLLRRKGADGYRARDGVMLLYYNKDLFDAAHLPYPPSKASEAWTWDQFLDVAKKLTKDRSGHTAAEAGFDPSSIDTYGVTFGTWWGAWLPFVYSNEGRFSNDEGTKLLLNQPARSRSLHGAAEPNLSRSRRTVAGAIPDDATADILMQSRKVAMAFDGMWKVTDFANLHMH